MWMKATVDNFHRS